MNEEAYKLILYDTFIKPVRSVLIIDDDYPTLDELISGVDKPKPTTGMPKSWLGAKDRLRTFVSSLKHPNNNRIVEIVDHVTADDKGNISTHLHQSDMLILDYELGDEGASAVKTVKELLQNKHFNLITIHTGFTLSDVFHGVLFTLLETPNLFKNEEKLNKGFDGIQSLEAEDVDVTSRIRKLMDAGLYFYCVGAKEYENSLMKKEEKFSEFCEEMDNFGVKNPYLKKNILYWYLNDFEERHKDNFVGVASVEDLTWSCSKILWVSCNEGFISFVSKEQTIENSIENLLVDALFDWTPNPAQLIQASIRNEMDKIGIRAERHNGDENHMRALQFKEIIRSEGDEKKYNIKLYVKQCIEEISNIISIDTFRIAEKICEVYSLDPSMSPDDREKAAYIGLKEVFGVNLKDDLELSRAKLAHNSFVSVLKSHDWYLDTGHVFHLEGNYWVCLTPACDMVPGQKSNGLHGEIDGARAFIGVKLHDVTGQNVDATANRCIYLPHKDGVVVLAFNKACDDTTAPDWFHLFAEDTGAIKNNKVVVSRVIKPPKGDFEINRAEATVLYKLRYEYALNFMQRLHHNLGRIGLDYK